MKLFEIDENFQVTPNKVWINMIPEFAILIKRDKGSKGDTEGRKKLKARRELVYIYMMQDFGAPIRDYEGSEKHKEALKYSNLTDDDIDSVVKVAVKKYEELQLAASRPLRTYKAMVKGLDALDSYFENVDFKQTDDDGKLLYSPDKYQNSMGKMHGLYDALDKFKKRVEEDLKNVDGGIRGQATLGDNEGRKTNANSTWSEQDIITKSAESAGQANDLNTVKADTPTFTSMSSVIERAGKRKLTDVEIETMKVLGEDIPDERQFKEV